MIDVNGGQWFINHGAIYAFTYNRLFIGVAKLQC